MKELVLYWTNGEVSYVTGGNYKSYGINRLINELKRSYSGEIRTLDHYEEEDVLIV